RVVVRERSRCLRLETRRVPGGALVFVFVGIVGAFGGCGASPRWTGEGARPHTIVWPRATRPRSAQLLHQLRRNLVQEPRWHTRLRHVSAIPPPIHSARQNQR